MAFTQKWNTDGVYIKYVDNLTSDELIESNSLLVGRREFESIKYVIADFSDITSFEIDDTDVNISTSFVKKVRPYNKHIKVALVSDNKDLQLLIIKYIENTLKIMPQAKQKLFSTMTDAKNWVAS